MSNMISNKRSRSQSRSESKDSKQGKRQRIDVDNYYIQKATTVEVNNKISCAFCGRDITKTIRIICDKCVNTEYCVDCLILNRGKEEGTHKHDYHISDKLDFSIFTGEWTANDELLFLSSKLIYF